MSIKRSITIFSFVFAFGISCDLFVRPKFHDIRAEIIEIKKQTATSVLVDFKVYSSGNADDCSFYVVRDTMPITDNTFPNTPKYLIIRARKCNLGNVSQYEIPSIIPGKKYYYQLVEWGVWNVSGQTSSRVVRIGSQYEYVLF